MLLVSINLNPPPPKKNKCAIDSFQFICLAVIHKEKYQIDHSKKMAFMFPVGHKKTMDIFMCSSVHHHLYDDWLSCATQQKRVGNTTLIFNFRLITTNIPFLTYPADIVIRLQSCLRPPGEYSQHSLFFSCFLGSTNHWLFFAGVFRVFRAGGKLIHAVNFPAGWLNNELKLVK